MMKTTLFLVFAAVLFSFAVYGEDTQKTPLTAEQLKHSVDQYYGKTVTVRVKPNKVVNSNVFTVDADPKQIGADLVILMPNKTTTIPANQELIVKGTLRRYVERDFIRDYDWFSTNLLITDALVDMGQIPVLVADSVDTPTGTHLMAADNKIELNNDRTGTRANDQSEAGESGAGSQMTETGERVNAGEIAKNPDRFYGKTVTVKAEVDSVFGPNAFTLDEDELFAGPDVLVFVMKAKGPAPQENQVVTVTGTVRKYDKMQLHKEFPDMTEVNIDSNVQNRPVIIANSIQQSGQND